MTQLRELDLVSVCVGGRKHSSRGGKGTGSRGWSELRRLEKKQRADSRRGTRRGCGRSNVVGRRGNGLRW
eukprot:539464-Rhodomonas_salina.1